MTTAANAGKGNIRNEGELNDQDRRNAEEARGHSERVEKEETIHRRTVDIDEGNRFKKSVRRLGSMWVQAACVAAGAAVGVGGTLLVQKRMNRTAANVTPSVEVHSE